MAEGGDAPGPVALVGSGEFLDAMVDVDAGLLAGRPAAVAVVPTAAGLEGEDRVGFWLALARRHYEAMGVEAVAVPVLGRAGAEDPAMARLIEGVGLVYLSGGDPHHLVASLAGTPLWRAVVDGWRRGTAVAGCSAGAMALTAGAPADLGPSGVRRQPADGAGGRGLHLVGGLAVIPHFDVLERRRPGVVGWFSSWKGAGTVLVGVEEETALVGGADGWRAAGRGSVWVFGEGEPARYGDGEAVPLPAVTA